MTLPPVALDGATATPMSIAGKPCWEKGRAGATREGGKCGGWGGVRSSIGTCWQR